MMKRGHADESPSESSSTNKADMSWLLNAGDDTEERGRGKPTPKARKHCASVVDRSVHDWLLQAPSLYRLPAHEGIAGAHPLGDANGHSSSSLSIASTVVGDDLAGRARPSLHRITAEAAGGHGCGRAPNPCDDVRTASSTRDRHFLSRSSSETSLDQSPDSGQDKDCVGDSGRKSWSVSLDESLAIQIYASRPRNAGSKYGGSCTPGRAARCFTQDHPRHLEPQVVGEGDACLLDGGRGISLRATQASPSKPTRKRPQQSSATRQGLSR